jgi:hypothetical protein
MTDGIDWDAFDRYYGTGEEPRAHEGAELAAAFYWLLDFVGAQGDEDWLDDEISDSVNELNLDDDNGNAADEIRYQLRKGYKGKPEACLKTIGAEVATHTSCR